MKIGNLCANVLLMFGLSVASQGFDLGLVYEPPGKLDQYPSATNAAELVRLEMRPSPTHELTVEVWAYSDG